MKITKYIYIEIKFDELFWDLKRIFMSLRCYLSGGHDWEFRKGINFDEAEKMNIRYHFSAYEDSKKCKKCGKVKWN